MTQRHAAALSWAEIEYSLCRIIPFLNSWSERREFFLGKHEKESVLFALSFFRAFVMHLGDRARPTPSRAHLDRIVTGNLSNGRGNVEHVLLIHVLMDG